jgi:hypothetical protein
LYHQNYDSNTDVTNTQGTFIGSQTKLDNNAPIFSTTTFINQGSGAKVGCYGLGQWQVQSTNYSISGGTTHSATITYLPGGNNWGALSSVWMYIQVYNTLTSGFVASNSVQIFANNPNVIDLTTTWTPTPGVTYKVFGYIYDNSFTQISQPICRSYYANQTTMYTAGGYTGYNSFDIACSTGTGGDGNQIFYNGGLGNGTILSTAKYTDSYLAGNDKWYFINGYSFQVNNSGVISNYTLCPSPSPTISITPSVTPPITPSSSPIAVYIHCLEYNSISCDNACNNYDPSGCFL